MIIVTIIKEAQCEGFRFNFGHWKKTFETFGTILCIPEESKFISP